MLLQRMSHSAKLVGLVAFITLGVIVKSGQAQIETGQAGEQDIAVIQIASPQRANLLQLQGYAGRVHAELRVKGRCYKMRLRFVAGNFLGRDASRRGATPIVMFVSSPKVVTKLMRGADIVSDTIRVSYGSDDMPGDLRIVQGLSAGTGFVLNPGTSVAADILGSKVTSIGCDAQSSPLLASYK